MPWSSLATGGGIAVQALVVIRMATKAIVSVLYLIRKFIVLLHWMVDSDSSQLNDLPAARARSTSQFGLFNEERPNNLIRIERSCQMANTKTRDIKKNSL